MKQMPMTMEPKLRTVNQTVLRLQRGDLTALSVDAFVFYAKENLELGSGFGTAIQTRGGEEVRRELNTIGPIRMGEAVMTTAGGMAAKHVIHACGPKFQEDGTENKLRDCLLSSLRCADKDRLKSIAYPPMGAGFYGIPLEMCARVMLETIRDFLRGETSLEEVIICVIDRREFMAFANKLETL